MVVRLLRIASAILLLTIGGIHLFLVLHGVSGLLGQLFVLNAIAGVALAAGTMLLRGRLLALDTVLALLFAIASLLALLTALTVGLFGIREVWSSTLVPQTVVVDSVAIAVLTVTTAVVLPAVAAPGSATARMGRWAMCFRSPGR